MAFIGPIALGSAEVLLFSCNSIAGGAGSVAVDNIQRSSETGETLLPATSCLAAIKAARTDRYMKVPETDGYWTEQKKIIRSGIKRRNDCTRKKYNRAFTGLSNA